MSIPLLILGDAPSLVTGLARIGRDLATAAARLPQFRVAYLGRGLGAHTGLGIADSRIPVFQYTYQPTPDDQWGMRVLPDVWRNWARGERGVIFTIWDASRLTTFGNPQPELGNDRQWAGLYDFLVSGEFERWGYFAIDAEGPGVNGALAPILARTIRGYDRVLAYSRFGKRVVDASFATLDDPHPDVDWLPHGINLTTFQPRDHSEARRRMGLPDNPNMKLVGMVASNQPRKDWGLWARTMQIVTHALPNVVCWVHTDSLTSHWDLRVLVETFGLEGKVVITTDTPGDVEMSWRYSACDLTVLTSLGEGFGYPIAESYACGVPVVHGNYAGGAELIPYGDCRVIEDARTLDTRYCVMRPVYDPLEFSECVLSALGAGYIRDAMVEHVLHLDWRELWPRRWEKWFVAGAERFER